MGPATAHIVILGEMGVGKTTVGSALAARLDVPLLDSDREVEAKWGRDAASIAAGGGVSELHRIELEVFVEMAAANPPVVLAPASSIVDGDQARSIIESNEMLVAWLVADDKVVVQRQSSGGHRRPVGEEQRKSLRRRRAGWLAKAAIVKVDTGKLTVDESVNRIIDAITDSD